MNGRKCHKKAEMPIPLYGYCMANLGKINPILSMQPEKDDRIVGGRDLGRE